MVLHAEVGHSSSRERIPFGDAIYRATNAVVVMAKQGVRIAVDRAALATLEDRVSSGRLVEEGANQLLEVVDFATPDVVSLVQSSFEQITSRAADFTQAFYARLFEIHPPLSMLFDHTDMEVQRTMLSEALALAVRSLHDLEPLVPKLRELGRRHVTFGVVPIHYKYFGRALLETLESFLGNDFTPEVHVAWMELHNTLVRTMLEA